MKAEFIARKSVFGDCGGRLFLCFLFCWLIVPIFIGIWLIMRASSYRLYFYPDKVVCTYGIIAKCSCRYCREMGSQYDGNQTAARVETIFRILHRPPKRAKYSTVYYELMTNIKREPF